MKFDTLYESAPFSKYGEEDYRRELKAEIEKTREKIEAIAESEQEASFANTIEELAYAEEDLDRVSSMFFNILSAESTDGLKDVAKEIIPLMSKLGNDITLNEKLFKRVEAVHKSYKPKDAEEKMLLETTYKSFVRNGANLGEEDKAMLRKIDEELSVKKLAFSNNILKETNEYKLVIKNEEDLKGLPDYAIEEAKKKAEEEGVEGWVIGLDFPSYSTFEKYADKRELRQELFEAYASRCYKGEKYDNRLNVIEIARLRYERARLLGYESHAEFTLERRMAKNAESVLTFLNQLLKKALPAGRKEFLMLANYAKETDGVMNFSKWDTAYYGEKLRAKMYNIDDEVLKPYFSLENVLKGAFEVAGKLYGLVFEEITNIDKYHEEVRTFEVKNEKGEYVALLYTDFHPRNGKRNGAWMTSFKRQYKKDGVNSRPHISIVCNFTRATKDLPSLLTFREVTTLFHEFGHALHGMLANTKYPELSGTSVYRDFVELPSQLMENWCYMPEALSLFARHYKTGEMIPMKYIEKIQESASFMEALQTLRQLSFGFLDMKWHTSEPKMSVEEVKAFEKMAMDATNLYPEIKDEVTSTAFSHIFDGGYSAGYYSYKWAEVLDADAFEYFKEKGIFNKEVAKSFRENVLEKGGSEDPMELYIRFRGKKPSIDALLKRAGIAQA